MENIYTEELRKLVEEFPNTNAWKRGVKEYADELLDNLEKMAQLNERLPKDEKELEEWLLNGAMDWKDYSYGGHSLMNIYRIKDRLGIETIRWYPTSILDTQADALCIASLKIRREFRFLQWLQRDQRGA